MTDDRVLDALTALMPGGVRRGELPRGGRVLRWVEAGSGGRTVLLDAALGEPGSLAWAGVMMAIGAGVRVIAYDRAGLGASDPVSPLTLAAQLDDLTELACQAGRGPCVLAGHSWGGLLAQLAAIMRPDLIAGLVLVDPADENFWSALPPEVRRERADFGTMILDRYDRGELAATVRDVFGPYVRRLSGSPRVRALLMDAYESSYAQRSQARMVRDEQQLFTRSVPAIRKIRASGPLPRVPVVVLSATIGAPGLREKWTALNAELAASVPGGAHVILQDTSHAINQERPGEIGQAIGRVIDDCP